MGGGLKGYIPAESFKPNKRTLITLTLSPNEKKEPQKKDQEGSNHSFPPSSKKKILAEKTKPKRCNTFLVEH